LGARLGRIGLVLGLAMAAAATASRPAAAWEMRVCADPDKMPFSRADGAGFENRIAKILAEEMGAEITYFWFPASIAMINDYLRTGECDVMMTVEDGAPTLTGTLAYFRSPYVFVMRADRPYRVEMFDDPILPTLKVGMQPAGGPTQDAFEVRRIGRSIVEFYDFELTTIIDDVISGKIDIGVLWGPAAGYYAMVSPEPLVVLPVKPEFEPPFTPMFLNMVIGFRRGEDSIRDLFDIAIAKRWEDIQRVLEDLQVPLMPLAAPVLTLEGR
jgi:ABC-type amino acid transport substrate-binding protein